MRVMLIGSGGREHAIGWKLAQSPAVDALFSVPGNPGLAELGEAVSDVAIDDPQAVVDAALARDADLVVVGPEAPLAAGVVDALEGKDIPAFGPSRAAARLEASKSYAKELMGRAGVPTAAGRSFTHPGDAARYLDRQEGPFVVKADGLAAGKGVLVTERRAEARAWIEKCATGDFGAAGRTIVIERFLDGPEVSVIVVCDGRHVAPLAPARDYKPLRDGDEGPNTGGMGCYSPVPTLDPGLVDTVVEHVVTPVLQELAADGVTYRGFLYAGLKLTDEGPQVLEFNCRLGDPEAQVILPRLESDLADLIIAALDGVLDRRPPRWSPHAAVDIVLAAPGYPASPSTGSPIRGLDEAAALPDVLLFHAGTRRVGDDLVTSGGRVINVVATGPDLESARRLAYEAAGVIDFPGKHYRHDIAHRAAVR